MKHIHKAKSTTESCFTSVGVNGNQSMTSFEKLEFELTSKRWWRRSFAEKEWSSKWSRGSYTSVVNQQKVNDEHILKFDLCIWRLTVNGEFWALFLSLIRFCRRRRRKRRFFFTERKFGIHNPYRSMDGCVKAM